MAWLAAAGTALSLADEVGGAVGKVISGISGLFGGDKKISGPCPGQPPDMVIDAVRRNAPPEELRAIAQYWESNKKRLPFMEARAFDIAKVFWGGDDCVKSDPWPVQEMTRLIERYGRVGDAPMSFATSSNASTTIVDRAREEVRTLPERIGGAIVEEVTRSVNRVAQPIVEERAADRFSHILPWILGGLALGVILRR